MVTVGSLLGGGFRLIRERIGAVAIWGLLNLAMNVTVMLMLRPVMRDMAALKAAGGAGNPAVMMAAMGQMFAVYLLLLVGMLIVYTAAVRATVRPAESAFAYLRVGADELRMLLVGLAFGVSFFAVYLVLALLIGVIGGAVALVSREAVIPVVFILGLVAFGGLIYLYVRFSPAFALTVLRRTVAIGDAWNVTRGRFWTLFGAYLVLTLMVFAASSLVFSVTSGSYLADVARSGMSPAALNAAQAQQMARQFGPVDAMMVVGWVLSAVLGTLWMSLSAGVMGTAAVALADEDFADVAEIYA